MTILVAPPGTRIGEPGWYPLPPGVTLRWDRNGGVPPLAVQRDGALMSTGQPPPGGHVTSTARGDGETATRRYVLHEDLGPGPEETAPEAGIQSRKVTRFPVRDGEVPLRVYRDDGPYGRYAHVPGCHAECSDAEHWLYEGESHLPLAKAVARALAAGEQEARQ